MRILVTGAAGFLGRHVVAEALRRGHDVVALVRRAGAFDAQPNLEERIVDLAEGEIDLTGLDAVVHCAASLSGGQDEQDRDTVLATQRLAAAAADVPRVVLLSSFALYDFTVPATDEVLDESCPLADPRGRHPYIAAKRRQEDLLAEALGERLVVLRPGLVYGPGRTEFHQLGLRLGGLRVALAGRSPLPLIHVDSCANAVLAATQCEPSSPLNLVDDDSPARVDYLRELVRRDSGRVVSVAWAPLDLAATVAGLLSLGGRLPLPGLLQRAALDERCKPLRYSNDAAREALDWQPLSDFRRALAADVDEQRPG